MSSTNVAGRIDQLLTQAREAVKVKNLQKAFDALKEASHLDPENAKVKQAWIALQSSEQDGRFLDHLRDYMGSRGESDGEQALRTLKQSPVTSSNATQALELLLNVRFENSVIDSVTGTLLIKNIDARKYLASRFNSEANKLFELFFDRGNESFRAFAALPLEDALWTLKEAQVQAQAGFFQLCVAKLIDVDVRCPGRAMEVMARQLAVSPENVIKIVDDHVFEIILDNLDFRGEASLRSQALLATSKFLEATKEKGDQMLTQIIIGKVRKQTNDDLISAFSAASAVFPVIPAVAAKLFMTDGFIEQLVPNLEKNSEAAASGQRKSRTLEQAALELLSAACVDKACREAINKHCVVWLRTISEEREGTHKALAALILAKISSSSQEEVTSKLANLAMDPDSEQDQAIEGLAYTSLQPKVKEEIASNQKLLSSLVTALHKRPGAIFGCLTIFTNLAFYRPTQSEEQKKISQLKAYANSSKPEPQDPLDNDSHVTTRCRKLVDAEVVPALVACSNRSISLTNVTLVVRLLLALSKTQKHRPKMTQQGAVRLLLQIRDRINKTDKSASEASAIERSAAHALARLLISVNPGHVFSASLPASSAVSALIPLLSLDQESETRDLLPTFESLLALTNLASMDDHAARDLQIRLAWDKIEDLLFSSNTLVQRASVELVCNLMLSPNGVAKFADGSKPAARRLHILLALTDVEDMATRSAAGGALAMLTEWDAAVTAILDQDRGVKNLLAMCADENEDIMSRGLVCVLNVVSAPADVGTRGIKEVNGRNGQDVLKKAMKNFPKSAMSQAGMEALKKLES